MLSPCLVSKNYGKQETSVKGQQNSSSSSFVDMLNKCDSVFPTKILYLRAN
jgi:hypothetical protein